MKKNFWLLWSGFTVSTLGTYLSLIVLNLFIYEATKSPMLVGVFLLLRLVPAFFMGNIAGLLADRYQRKYLMIAADLCRSALIFSVIFLREDIFPLYFIIFGIAICDRVYQSAMGGSIPNVAGQENILSANAYLASGRTIALVTGPLIGGLLLSVKAFDVAFAVDAASYLFSAIMVSLITANFHAVAAGTARKVSGLWQGIKEGYGFIFARAGLLSIILLRCLDAFGSSAINVGTPIFAESLRQFTPGVCYGLIYAAFGAGEIIGSLYLARHKYMTGRPPELVLGYSILFMALFFGLAFSAGNLWGTMFFMFLSAIAEGLTAVTYNIYLQKSPDDIRGRVVGTSETGVWTSMGIGMFLSGVIAEVVSISHVVQLFAAIIIIGCVWHLVKLRRSVRCVAQDFSPANS